MRQQATGKEIVFVGSARVGRYQLNGHEVRRIRFGNNVEANRNILTKRMRVT